LSQPAKSAEAGIWLFTSGTTDTPQAHFRSLELTISMVQRVLERLPTEISHTRPASLAAAPLYHGYGLINCLLLPHAFGGSIVLSENEDARHLAELLVHHQVQVIYGWPAHFKLLADTDISPLLRDAPLRWCVSSSSKLDAETAHIFHKASGCPLRQQYGMTETGPLCLDTETDAANDTSCIGHPFKGIEINVMNDRHEPLKPGETGMLSVRFTPGFACPPYLTPGQFWQTGDVGKIDSLGRVYLLKRAAPFSDERKEV
jgi:long-chain acyl-CoA synthetase